MKHFSLLAVAHPSPVPNDSMIDISTARDGVDYTVGVIRTAKMSRGARQPCLYISPRSKTKPCGSGVVILDALFKQTNAICTHYEYEEAQAT
jgi:hypothetical protein